MTSAAKSTGFPGTRWTVIACVAILAVAYGIAQLGDRTSESTVEDAGVGAVPQVPEEPPEAAVFPVAIPDDVVSRVDATRVPAVLGADSSVVVESHIGPRLDPEVETYGPSDTGPSHIGEYLDPDDGAVSLGNGRISHIGENLDPLADE